jgi:hypothetical protein
MASEMCLVRGAIRILHEKRGFGKDACREATAACSAGMGRFEVYGDRTHPRPHRHDNGSQPRVPKTTAMVAPSRAADASALAGLR